MYEHPQLNHPLSWSPSSGVQQISDLPLWGHLRAFTNSFLKDNPRTALGKHICGLYTSLIERRNFWVHHGCGRLVLLSMLPSLLHQLTRNNLCCWEHHFILEFVMNILTKVPPQITCSSNITNIIWYNHHNHLRRGLNYILLKQVGLTIHFAFSWFNSYDY